jgi:hypothetical protein
MKQKASFIAEDDVAPLESLDAEMALSPLPSSLAMSRGQQRFEERSPRTQTSCDQPRVHQTPGYSNANLLHPLVAQILHGQGAVPEAGDLQQPIVCSCCLAGASWSSDWSRFAGPAHPLQDFTDASLGDAQLPSNSNLPKPCVA